MKKIFTTLLILLSFQCRIFKPSDLDPSQDLGTLQTLLRYLALADAFNTYSQTVAFMKFADPNGTPYAGGTAEYFVFNEADENGVPVSPFGDTGNIQPYTVTLDAYGRGFLFFSERGIAKITVKNSGNADVGNASFRVYNGITKQSFFWLSQSGSTQFILEDLANYRNRLGSSNALTSLGSANGRQFLYLQVQTSYTSSTQYSSTGYIISSADGEYYDQVTKIDGVNLKVDSGYETFLKISKPMFNGSEYVFFLSEERSTYPAPGTYQSNRNLIFKIPQSFPSASEVVNLPIASNANLYRPDAFPWIYPAFYFSSRYLVSPAYSSGTQIRPTLLNENFAVTQDAVLGFSCMIADSNLGAISYQLINVGGTEYLQCQNTSSLMNSQTIQVRSLDSVGLSNRVLTFDTGGGGYTFQSPIFYVRGKLVGLLNFSPNVVGFTFPTDNYGGSSPTITKNTSPITGFSSTLASSDPLLRSVKSSSNSDFFLLSTSPTSISPNYQIYRSTDSLASASILPAIPAEYSSPISNAEQLQSANGKLNYTWSIYGPIGIGSLPVFLTRFTNDDGSWETLPRLIKIR
ncbi:hypothetical protein ND861_11730 [Leptospira sp. 2 VSF19]|uniref:Lipoprotein n=1 Tax=Leptospira soteropolitanensis TaxID=2950025 RepID=A0AAW5VMN6_9LEPT|nr:hypothetical protein [Leptospira soteropolitanensis]MCW7493306.1 hypothetical protein [Leptospira soteropolitanensis]MCW7501162.1 hypothetical protein [Leptospira soteropolitanensis]MCW7523158.1 hypothetical protein [Leptospira soteropolitanensis]MCW7527019.1 hypothetical protein [Leptospira soteropolitanensis]MCW7530876.1 hypothetical protein [Leptospira soteropolitanensis]